MAAVDIFLKLDGIQGESHDRVHHDEIELASFSFGLTNPGSHVGASGQGAGKSSFQEIHVTSNVSKASPKLMLACAEGRHIKDGVITFRKAGELKENSGFEFLFYKLQDVLITSVQEGGDTSDVPKDAISMSFAKIHVEYKEQTPAGGLGAVVDFSWDLKANKKL